MTMRQLTYRSVALGLGAIVLAAACQRSERGQAGGAGQGQQAAAPAPPQFTSVTDQMLLDAGRDTSNAANWMMYGGAYNNQRYSVLDQVNKANVKNLALAWTYKTGVQLSFETTPVVVNGIMYMTTANSKVIALNAVTGQQMWRYEPTLTTTIICCGPNNRGVAVYGDRVFVATLDDRLIALNQRDGSVAWQTQIDDPTAGYSQTAAPLVADGKLIVGTAGAEYGIRGYLKAFNPQDGKLLWTWYTIPAPGEAPNGWWGQWKETDPFGAPMHRDIAQEKRDSARYANAWRRGGGSTWMTPAYDPDTKTLYTSIGNPSPDLNGSVRPGDNLYTDAVVAVDITTGKLKWYVQTVPHDVWDLDAVSPPILFVRNGRKLIGHAGKTGWVYVIDAADGTPVRRSLAFVPQENMFAPPTAKGVRMLPGANGGSEWSPMAYSPRTALTYALGLNQPMTYSTNPEAYKKGQLWLGSAFKAIPGEPQSGTFTAINVDNGQIAWQQKTAQPMIGGALATAGDVVFVGEANGSFDAFDAANGNPLWQYKDSAGVNSAPMTYAVGGVQYVAVAAGGNFQIGSKYGDDLLVFALRDRMPPLGQRVQQAPAPAGASDTTTSRAGAHPTEMNPSGAGATGPVSAPTVDPSNVKASMRWDAATKSMTLPMVSGLTKNAGGWNFDGQARGSMTIVVPVGTKVTFPYYNEDIVPHSLGVVAGSPTNVPSQPSQPAFPQAMTKNFQQGIPTNQGDTVTFTADKAGTYLIVCGVAGHAASGMWVVFQVSATATQPQVTTKS
jgi:alcohol dehydrogenase (cytochrome c)